MKQCTRMVVRLKQIETGANGWQGCAWLTNGSALHGTPNPSGSSYPYFRDVLTRLPYMTNWQIKEVTPHAWAAAQQEPASAAA